MTATPSTGYLSTAIEYAGFWRRTWAFVLDIVFWCLIAGLASYAIPEEAAGAVILVLIVAGDVMLTMLGGTIGKRMLGLRVVRASDGSSVDVIRAFLRDIVVKPLSILCLGVGVLWMLDSSRRQTWHDSISDTVVVREIHGAGGPSWAAEAPWLKAK
jgi:uncharacterized RDD family membrane protein YckC